MTSEAIRITGGRVGITSHLSGLLRNLPIAYFLVTRDLKVRYRQTLLGAAWVVLQPLVLALILAVFLGRFAKLPSPGGPYIAFALVGLAPWTYLANAVEAGTNSFVNDINLVSKVYVPRLAISVAAALSHVVDLAIALFVALVVAVLTGSALTLKLAFVPLIALWAIVVACAVGTGLGALNVKYRDVRAGVRFGIQAWFFLTPVVYSLTLVPSEYRLLYSLNPAASIVSLSRWALIDGESLSVGMLLTSLGATALIVALALTTFNRLERQFADSI